MSGLLDAVRVAIFPVPCPVRSQQEVTRAAVEAVAAWLDHEAPRHGMGTLECLRITDLLRNEVAPPTPTPLDVIAKARNPLRDAAADAVVIAAALRDAGMLREQDAIRAERWSAREGTP